MQCPRCSKIRNQRVSLKPIKRKGGFHKQTKFTCPKCGFSKMKRNK